MSTNAWFQLTTELTKAEARYRDLAQQCFDRHSYQEAAHWKSIAEGLSYARAIQGTISAEARAAVGSATQHTRPHGAQLT